MAGKHKDNKPDKPVVRFRHDGSGFWLDTRDDMWKQFIMDCCYHEDGLEMFCKYFLKDSFKRPFTKERREFARRISNTAYPNQLGVAYRGFGKTTLIWAECVRRLCFRLNTFLVYASSEQALAERRTEAIRSTMISNPRIRKFFGTMAPQYLEGVREVFGSKSWKLADPNTGRPFCICVPKSDGMTVNGLVEMIGDANVRPDLMIVDDIVDRFRVDDETYRKKLSEWLFGTLFPCADNEAQPDPVTHMWSVKRGERAPWSNILIDTYKHADAVTEMAAQDPEWIAAKYPLARDDDEGNIISLVDHLSDEQVQAMYNRFARIGQESRFYKEYMCCSRTAGDAAFPSEFQYYLEKEVNLDDPEIVRFIIVDPARTANPRSAYTAMLAVAVDCRHAKVYLRGMVHGRLGYDEIGEQLIGFAVRMNTDILAVEDAGLNDFIRGPLEKYAMKCGLNAQWLWLPASRKNIDAEGEFRNIKEARASSALWLYRPFGKTHPMGHVWHEESMRNGPLEGQMASYPECKRWDALDTLGYVDYVMRELGLPFDKQALAEVDESGNRLPSEYERWGEWIKSGRWVA